MNVSNVQVKLSGEDLLGMVNENVHVEGLVIETIDVDDDITVMGTFSKGIDVEFVVKVHIIRCQDNKIYLKLSEVRALKLKAFRKLRSFVLRQISKEAGELGISNIKDILIVDMKKLLKNIPKVSVDFDLDEFYVSRAKICVGIKNIKVDLNPGPKEEEPEEKEEVLTEKEIEEQQLKIILDAPKVVDNYSRGRCTVIQKLEDTGKKQVLKYKDYLLFLPDIVSLVYRLLKDERVEIKTKLMMSAAVSYLVMPIDVIPDWIPVIGAIDDLGVLFFMFSKILSDVKFEVIAENWSGNSELFLVMKKAVEYLSQFSKVENVEKLYNMVDELSKL